MENSDNSASRALSYNMKSICSNEESSWSLYFEDLWEEEQLKQCSFSSSCHESLSLVSDAASVAIHKKVEGNESLGLLYLDKKSRNSSCQRKMVDDAYDDSLEDTATSPVRSPEGFTLEILERNPTPSKTRNISLGKRRPGQVEEKMGLDFVGGVADCTDLKKMGLCLVPLSMVGNSPV